MLISKKQLTLSIGIIVILAIAVPVVESAAPAAPDFPPANPEQPAVADLKFPQIAEVTGDDVNVRSGPSTTYYISGKLNRGDRVTVVEVQQNSWAKILPPPGSYSWISKQYVQLTPDNPMVGTVAADEDGAGARVWAGSDFFEPLHSNSQQVKLYRGDVVELAAPADTDEGYFKIKPPAGAHLYVSMDYLKLLGTPEEQKPIELPQRPDVEGPVTEPSQLPMDTSTEPAPIEEFAPGAQPETKTPTQPEPAKKSPEAQAMEKVNELSEMIDQELTKPLMSQDYTVIKEALAAIQADPQTGRAQAYAQLLIERIGRYELAAEVNRQLTSQEENLESVLTRIDRAREAQLRQIASQDSPYLFVGTVKPSHVYTGKTGPKRYLLTDPAGKILCYVLPESAEAQVQLDMLVGKKAGIFGTLMADSQAIITTVLVRSAEQVRDAAASSSPTEN